jgi:hypothetical protein
MTKENEEQGHLIIETVKSDEPLGASLQLFKEALSKFSQQYAQNFLLDLSVISDLQGLPRELIQAMKPQVEISKQLREFSAQITNQFKEILENINYQWLEDIVSASKRLKSRFLELDTQAEEIAPILQKASLWIPPFASLDFIRQVIELCKNPDITSKDLADLYINLYSENDYALLREMVQSWQVKPYFAERFEVINDALIAHLEHKYTLTIPALLPQIEGIALDISGNKGGHPERTIRDLVGDQNIEVLASVTKEAFLGMLESTLMYTYIGKDFFSPEKFPEYLANNNINAEDCLNRHAILHGVQKNYANEINSLRIFLFLDTLSDIDECCEK